MSKAIVAIACMIGLAQVTRAQFAVTTNSGSGLAPTYGSLAAAITALNAATITSPVVITCPTGTETAPASGYSITAQGTAANTITIQGNGAANSVITAANPAGGSGSLTDGIFKLIGADYVTIQGFTMQENALNATTTSASNNMTEWGVALLYAGTAATANGAKNNTIQNNTITLNRSYANSFGIYSSTRHTATSVSAAAEAASAAGAHTDNKIYGNSMSNVNLGICLIGANADAVMDTGFDIGGSASGTGNTFSNWGNTTVVGGFMNVSGTVFCAYLFNQKSINFSYNTLTSASLSSVSATRGIFLNYGTAPTSGSFTNSITNNTVTVTTTAAPTFEMIRHAGMSTALSGVTINLNNNTLLNCSSGGEFVGIINNNSAPGTLNISGNIIRGTTQSGTTSPYTGIQNTGAAVNQINITNNQIGNASGNAVSFSAANSSAVTGITNTGGATTCALTMTGNDFRGFVHSVTGSSAHTYLNNTAATLSQNISNNTFTNLNVNTTGSVTFIGNAVNVPAAGSMNVNNNQVVTAFNKGGAGGTVTFYSSNASSVTGSTLNFQNNNISNVTLTGLTGFVGINNTDGGSPTKTITGNTISNISGGTGSINPMTVNFMGATSSVSNNTISNINWGAAITALSIGSTSSATTLNVNGNSLTNISSTAGAVTGITVASPSTTTNVSNNTVSGLSSSASGITGMAATGGATVNMEGNTVHTLSSTAAATSVGISVTGGTSVLVSRNKIYNGEANNGNGSISGIQVNGGTTVNLQNNLIGDLRTPATSAVSPLNGIFISAGTTVNVRYNTVYLNGTSTGVNWGSSAIQVGTTSTVTLNNNILVNTSTPSGANLTVAYRRTTTTLTTYGAGSNNNLFYAGTPGAQRLIFHDSNTGDQTLAAFKTRVSTRDAASVTENPPFLSTVGSNANFLHINAATATAIESGGVTVSGITTDYDGDTRNAITPDIGADEGAFTPLSGCTGAPNAGTSSVSGGSSACVGGTKALANTGATADLGITYQWQVSTTSGSGYANVTGGTGANTTNYTTGTLSAGTYYYVLLVTCTNSGLSTISNEVTITVNPLPTVLVNGVAAATGTYCYPGGTAVALTASGASTYAWSPAGGLSATTGASVTASPSATTTYTVTGTDANGCVGTATAAITVASSPINVTATATPSSICSGATSNLTSSAFVQNTAALPSGYTFNGATGSYSAITGTTLPNGVGDDVGNGNLPIGFTFNYNGVAQTIFSASSNGVIFLGDATPSYTSGFLSSNALATSANKIAAFWDDNNTTGGSIQYLTTGSVGSRVLTVQWTGMHTGGTGSSTNPTINVQAKLFEATGAIQFVYGTTSAALASTTASIGISGASGNFISVTPLSPPNTSTTSTATENTGISSATNIPSGTTYTFTPPSLTLSYAWAPAGDVASPSSQNTATNALAATTTFTVTASNAGCTATANTTVTISPLSCGALTTAGTACVGSQTVTANPSGGGAPYSYAWTEDGLPFGGNTPTITATVGTHTYACTVTDACTSTCSSSLSVTTNALPTVQINGSANATGNYCTPAGPALALNATGASTYAWSPATGLSATTGASVTASPSASTTYTVTGTDANGCVNTATVAVTVAATPQSVTASASPTSVCSGGTSTLTASALNNVGTYAFTATSGTFTPISGGTAVATSTSAADFLGDTKTSVSLPIGFPFVMDGVTYNNVVAMSDGYLSFNASATSALTNNLATSAATQRPLVAPLWDDLDGASGSGAANYITTGTAPNRVFTIEWLNWQWNWQATGATISFQVKLYEANNSIEFIYRQETGAVNSASASIGIAGVATGSGNYLSLNGTGTAPTASSTSETTSLSAKPATGQVYRFTPQSLTYSWAPAGLVVSPSTAVTATTALAATQAYTVTVTNYGCPATANATVTVNPPITAATITGNLGFCTGGSTTLTATPTDGVAPYTYLWSPGGQTTASIAVNTAGTYSCQVGDACSGSVNTGTVSVVENPLPTVTIPTIAPPTAANCDGAGVTLTASGASTYSWAPATGLNTTSGSTVTSTATATTTYTVTGTDANGCQNTAAQLVNLGNNPVISSVTATPAAICGVGNSNLNVVAGSSTTTHTGASFTVPTAGPTNASPYPGTISVSGITGTLSDIKVNITNLTHTWPTDLDVVLFGPTGAHSIIFTDAIGGSGGVTGRNYTFQIGATALPTTGFPASGTYGVVNGTSYSGSGTPSAATSANLSNFLGTNPNGTWSLYVYDDANSDGGSIGGWSLDLTVGAPATTYNWSPATFLSATNISNPEAQNINATTTYSVTATTAIGCSAQGNVTVTVNPLPVVTCGSYGPVCADAADITLGGSPAGGTWSGTGVTGNSFDPSVGTQTLTYSYTDGNGCSASCSTTITVNPLPVVSCGGPYAPQCDNAAPLALSGSPMGGTWSGTAVDGDTFDPSLAGAGSWTLTYTYTDGNGCTASCQTTVTVNAATLWYVDADGDGHGDIDDPGVLACDQPIGTVSSNDDECDNDPLKVETGICGCGVAETDTDGDTFADCIDGCPNDPLKQNPGACGCGTPDVDSDGDTAFDCVDGCPTDPNKIAPGACGCGSPDVDTDGDTVLDCNDGCPTDASKLAPGTCGCGNPEPGAACDDGNANTINDVVTAGCICAGTPTTPIYSLDITTDAAGTQTSWDITPLGGGGALCSGSGYPNGTTTTVFCPLPDAGCYLLTVYDAMADGMCCMNGNGGYVLRAPGGARIIDAANNGIFTSSASVALGFCTPIGTDRLTDSRCDRVDYLPSDFVQAIPNAAVQAQFGTGNQSDDGYQFWFFNPNGGYSRRVLVTHATSNTIFPVGPDRCSYLRLSSIITSPLPLNVLLNVRVRRQVNGVFSEFGSACRFKIDTESNCPTTQLVATPGPTLSCGITGVMLNGSRTLYAVPVPGANRYQFEFSKPGYLRKITVTSSNLNLTVWFTMPLQYNSTYNVRVRISYDGGVTYCPFGATCTIATAASPSGMALSDEPMEGLMGQSDQTLTMWPNPNNEGRVRFSMNGLGEGPHAVGIAIYDLMGALVQNEQLNIDGETLNTTMDLEPSMARGVYVVNVTVDGQLSTERLVIQ